LLLIHTQTHLHIHTDKVNTITHSHTTKSRRSLRINHIWIKRKPEKKVCIKIKGWCFCRRRISMWWTGTKQKKKNTGNGRVILKEEAMTMAMFSSSRSSGRIGSGIRMGSVRVMDRRGRGSGSGEWSRLDADAEPGDGGRGGRVCAGGGGW
jgi:hypothetical protein